MEDSVRRSVDALDGLTRLEVVVSQETLRRLPADAVARLAEAQRVIVDLLEGAGVPVAPIEHRTQR